MRLIALMAVRNEADRYLDAALKWLKPQVDHIFVVNDQSDDQSLEICLANKTDVYTRSPDSTSFLAAEGYFRQNAWSVMDLTYGLNTDDWVLGIDADEFTVEVDIRTVCQDAAARGYGSVDVRIPEIFCLTPLSRRVDGYWGDITGTRLVRYQPGNQKFRTTKMGSGMFPSYAYKCRNWKHPDFKILHYGYACEEDRKSKYARYTSLDANGHSNTHIQSILLPPRLMLWEGQVPEVWRGTR